MARIQWNSFKLIQTGSNWFKPIETDSNCVKLIQTDSNIFKLLQTDSNWVLVCKSLIYMETYHIRTYQPKYLGWALAATDTSSLLLRWTAVPYQRYSNYCRAGNFCEVYILHFLLFDRIRKSLFAKLLISKHKREIRTNMQITKLILQNACLSAKSGNFLLWNFSAIQYYIRTYGTHCGKLDIVM